MNILFWGKVRRGKSRGRKLGFPTANIALHQKIPEGVYVSQTKVKTKWHPSLTFIGAAKTFGEKKVQAETYILRFSPVILGSEATPESNADSGQARLAKASAERARMTFDLYDQLITIKLLKKLRENKKFTSKEELVKQMRKDEKEARKYFS